MITRVGLTHFKCFETLALECGTLNLLCGVNGTGKSSLIQALLLLRQSVEAGDIDTNGLVLRGELVDLGTIQDIVFEDAEKDVLRIDLEYGGGRWQAEMTPSHADSPVRSRPVWGWGLSSESDDDFCWEEMPPFGGDLIYIPADRVGPRKAYPLSEASGERVDFGPNSEHAWSYLLTNQDRRLPAGDARAAGVGPTTRTIDLVDHWLGEICPGAHLDLHEVREIDLVASGFTFNRTGDVRTRRHRATNVGFGLSYALPVILALLSPPETLCLIENPEAHLHPRGQTKMAELAARASYEGIQVFAETHSDHFLDGVRIAIKDGLVEAKDVNIHYFERRDNRSFVTSPTIDAEGRLSSWPVGFFDQQDENLARLLAPGD